MPSLTPDDRRTLLGPLLVDCRDCGGLQVRHYCRSCDVFFTTCPCQRGDAHADHRRYLWTAEGVQAIPNFDDL